jgi:hypothetical protein
MDQFVKSLRNRRAILQSRIEEEQSRPVPDSIRLRILKKLRLRFRDQIEFIERMKRNGQSEHIPVIRTRLSRSTVFGGSRARL